MAGNGRFGKYGDHKRKAGLREARVARSLVNKAKERAAAAKPGKFKDKK